MNHCSKDESSTEQVYFPYKYVNLAGPRARVWYSRMRNDLWLILIFVIRPNRETGNHSTAEADQPRSSAIKHDTHIFGSPRIASVRGMTGTRVSQFVVVHVARGAPVCATGIPRTPHCVQRYRLSDPRHVTGILFHPTRLVFFNSHPRLPSIKENSIFLRADIRYDELTNFSCRCGL